MAEEIDLYQGQMELRKQAKIDEGRGNHGELTTDEREELRRLRREARLRQIEIACGLGHTEQCS